MRLPACLLLALLALPAAARTRTVVGAVSDAAGRPVMGATVRVFQLPPDAPAWAPWQSCGAIDPATKRSFSCADEARLRIGRVQKRRGQAREVAQTRTDARGAFQLKGLSRGSYSLWAEGPGGGAAVSALQVPSEQRMALFFQPPVLEPLRIEDEAARRLAGVVVTLVAIPSGRFFTLTSDARGEVPLRALPPGEYAAVVQQRGFLPEHMRVDTSEAVPEALTLYRPRSFIGYLHRADVPAAGAEILLDGQLAARTNAEGLFAVEGLRAGSHRLEARVGDGYLVKHVQVGGRLGSEQPVDLELEPLRQLMGRVIDTSGRAVPQAEVVLQSREEGFLPPFVTDAQGRFRQWLEPGNYSLVARSPGRVSCAVASITLEDAEPQEVTCTLGTQVAVKGRVLDPQGKPVPGAEVSAYAEPEQWPRPSATTDADGRFSLMGVGAGDVLLQAKVGTSLAGSVAVAAPSEAIVVQLEPLGSLTVRVEDARGQPVAGAELYLGGPGLQSNLDLVSNEAGQHSDASGLAHFRGLPADAYEVTARHTLNGLHLEAELPVQVEEGTETRVALRLEVPSDLRPLSGRVVSSEGKPIEGAEVWASRMERDAPVGQAVSRRLGGGTRTDANGRFTFAALPPGRYQLRTTAEGYQQGDDEEAEPGDEEVELTLSRQHYVLGRVVDAVGAPVPRVSVDGYTPKAPEGELRLPIHADGVMLLHIGAPGFAEVVRRVEVQVDRDADLGQVVLREGAALRGVVVASDGHTPVVGIEVELLDEREDGQQFGASTRARTNELGQFRFDNAPEHARLLRVDAGARGTARQVVRDASQTLRLQLVENVTVQGRVLDAAGSPLLEAWVELRCVQGPWGRTQTDGEGHYALHAAPRSTCTVVAEPRNALSAAGALPQAYAPVELQLPATGALEVVLRPRQGKASLRVRLPEANEFVQAALLPGRVALPREAAAMERLRRSALPETPDTDFLDANGRIAIRLGSDTFRYQGLDPGLYTLILTEQSGTGLRAQRYAVTLREGAEQTLSVPIPSAGTVLEP